MPAQATTHGRGKLSVPAACSTCSRPIDVHQQVRGGTCDNLSCRAAAAKRWIAGQRTGREATERSIASAHLQTLVPNGQPGESEVALVVLPGSIASLQPVSSERRQKFSESVAHAVAASAAIEPDKGGESCPPEDSAQPPGSIAAACATCRGFCCRTGGDSAYIDAVTIRRVRLQRPELGADELVGLYEDAVPGHSMDGSCIFHADHGCALPRELRSHTCNDYFCKPMRSWIERPAQTAQSTAVVVLHEGRVVRSRLIHES